jgi:hypothetical protein
LISPFDPNLVTGINEIKGEIPGEFRIYNNYPNPFNPSTKIKFELPLNSFVELSVYDAAGRKVAGLINAKMQAGVYETDWNAESLNSGVYFARLTAGGFVKTVKMMLLK